MADANPDAPNTGGFYESSSLPQWTDITNNWLKSGGAGTNAAPWGDPSKPNEMEQFNKLYSGYQGSVDLFNKRHGTTNAPISRDAALGTPVSYNPDLVGKGGGFFGSDFGKLVEMGALGAGAAFLGPEIFGAFGGEAAGAGAGFLSDLPAWAGGAAPFAGDIVGGAGLTGLASGAGAGLGIGDAALAGSGLTGAGAGAEPFSFGGAGSPAFGAPGAQPLIGDIPGGGGGVTPQATPPAQPGQVTPSTTPQLAGNPVGGSPEAPPDPNARPGLPQTPPTSNPLGNKSQPGATDPSFIQKAINSVTKNPLQAGALGLNAFSQFNANKNGKSAQDQLKALSQPAQDASKQLIGEGMAGNVPAPIMQQFQTTFNNAKSAIEGRYANMGRDPNNDSSAQAEIKQAKDQMDAQVANYASQLLTQGLSAAGVAAGPATASINAGVAQDKELSASMAQALQQMAMLQAMQQGKTQQP